MSAVSEIRVRFMAVNATVFCAQGTLVLEAADLGADGERDSASTGLGSLEICLACSSTSTDLGAPVSRMMSPVAGVVGASGRALLHSSDGERYWCDEASSTGCATVAADVAGPSGILVVDGFGGVTSLKACL